MNALQLAQRLAREIGIPGSGPTTIVGQTGELGRVVNWLQSAKIDVESTHQDWEFLRGSTSFTTVDGQAIYTPTEAGVAAGTFGKWHTGSFRSYSTSAGYGGEIAMSSGLTYDQWRDAYYMGSMKDTRSQPLVLAVAPNKSLCIGPVPASGWTITGDYYRAPSEFADDTDEPDFPAAFHLVLVYRAMMHAGGFDAASEVYQRGEAEFRREMLKLSRDQLPTIEFGGALA